VAWINRTGSKETRKNDNPDKYAPYRPTNSHGHPSTVVDILLSLAISIAQCAQAAKGFIASCSKTGEYGRLAPTLCMCFS
jgi:hypothetical protein